MIHQGKFANYPAVYKVITDSPTLTSCNIKVIYTVYNNYNPVIIINSINILCVPVGVGHMSWLSLVDGVDLEMTLNQNLNNTAKDFQFYQQTQNFFSPVYTLNSY